MAVAHTETKGLPMSTVVPNTVIVSANLPGYDGPFVIEVPTLDADTESTHQSAARRAMFSLMAAGHFDPPSGMGSAETLREFFTTEYR